MFRWFRKYVRKIGVFGVEVEFHPPTDTPTNNATSVQSQTGEAELQDAESEGESASVADRSHWVHRVTVTTRDIVDGFIAMLQAIDPTLTPRYNKQSVSVLRSGRRLVTIWTKKDWVSAGFGLKLTDAIQARLVQADLEYYDLGERLFSVYVQRGDLQRHHRLFNGLLQQAYDELS